MIRFYRIIDNEDGTADVWLTPGEAVQTIDDLTGRRDFTIRLMAVRGVALDDPRWDNDFEKLEEHIREHHEDWLKSAEVIEI